MLLSGQLEKPVVAGCAAVDADKIDGVIHQLRAVAEGR